MSKAPGAPARPLDVAAAATRTAARALSAEERAQRERERVEAEGDEPLSQEEQAFFDQVEAIDDAIAELTSGEEKVGVEVWLHEPPPSRRRWIATLGQVEPGHLREELIGACQASGKWGDRDAALIVKVKCPGPHDNCRGNLWHVRRNVPRLAIHVPKTEAAVAAAAQLNAPAPTGSLADPVLKTVLEKTLERSLNPPKEAGTGELIENAGKVIALGKELGLIGAAAKPDDLVTKLVAGVPALKTLLEVFRPAPSATDAAMQALLVKVLEQNLTPRAGGGGLADKLASRALDFLFEGGFAGGAGERSMLGEAKELLVGVLDTEAGRSAGAGFRDLGAAILHRVRGGVAAGPETAGAPAASGAIGALQHELARAASTGDQHYFHTFVDRVRALFPQGGAQIIDGVAAGQITDEQALAQLGGAGIQLTPSVATYLRTLMNWLRYTHRRQGAPTPAAAPPPTNGVKPSRMGRCQQCGAMYDDCDPESFNQPCEACGGAVSPVVDGAA